MDFCTADAGEGEDFCRSWQEERLVSCRNMQQHGHQLAPPEILPRFMLSFKRGGVRQARLDGRQAENAETSKEKCNQPLSPLFHSAHPVDGPSL